jgi:hypothetical protein
VLVYELGRVVETSLSRPVAFGNVRFSDWEPKFFAGCSKAIQSLFGSGVSEISGDTSDVGATGVY